MTDTVHQYTPCIYCGELALPVFGDNHRLAGYRCDECKAAWTAIGNPQHVVHSPNENPQSR